MRSIVSAGIRSTFTSIQRPNRVRTFLRFKSFSPSPFILLRTSLSVKKVATPKRMIVKTKTERLDFFSAPIKSLVKSTYLLC